MIQRSEIGVLAARIGHQVNALQVILFGSHAQGTARADSDIDLLIIAESDLPVPQRISAAYRAIVPYSHPVDMLVYTPAEIQRLLKRNWSVAAKAYREGQLVYER